MRSPMLRQPPPPKERPLMSIEPDDYLLGLKFPRENIAEFKRRKGPTEISRILSQLKIDWRLAPVNAA